MVCISSLLPFNCPTPRSDAHVPQRFTPHSRSAFSPIVLFAMACWQHISHDCLRREFSLPRFARIPLEHAVLSRNQWCDSLRQFSWVLMRQFRHLPRGGVNRAVRHSSGVLLVLRSISLQAISHDSLCPGVRTTPISRPVRGYDWNFQTVGFLPVPRSGGCRGVNPVWGHGPFPPARPPS